MEFPTMFRRIKLADDHKRLRSPPGEIIPFEPIYGPPRPELRKLRDHTTEVEPPPDTNDDLRDTVPGPADGGLTRKERQSIVSKPKTSTWPAIGRIKIREGEQTRRADQIKPEDTNAPPLVQRGWDNHVPRPGQLHDIDERQGLPTPKTKAVRARVPLRENPKA